MRARGAGLAAVLLAVPGGAAYIAGRECADAITVPDKPVWTAAVGLLGVTGAAIAAARVTRWAREGRHLAVDIPEEELDAAALALLDRVRAERRARGEVAR